MIFHRFSVWLALAGAALAAWVVLTAGKTTPMPTPVVEPPRSPFETTVAATGIIEAANENVRIGPPTAGLVTKVFVTVGDRVREGDPLLQLDDRDLRAQLVARQAAIPPDYGSIGCLPMGSALGVHLTRGRALLPGVWLGSMDVIRTSPVSAS